MKDVVEACTQLFCDYKIFRSNSKHRDRLRSAIRESLLFSQPFRFISYWGIGRKHKIGNPERNALKYQLDWANRLCALTQASCSFEYLITDTHARINKIPTNVIRDYSESVTALFSENECQTQLMSEFLLDPKVATPYSTQGMCEITQKEWLSLSPDKSKELERLATLRVGTRNSHHAAMSYFAACLVEGICVKRLRPNSVFVTYQSPSMDFLLPPLPLIHAYVDRNKKTQRPWFVGETT